MRDMKGVPNKSGSIYYARLLTEFGPLYKLGYTSLASVHERLAFRGLGEEKLIEEVLLFCPTPSAFADEQALHRFFGNKRAFSYQSKRYPLFENGQTEIYIEDILEIDWRYTEEQAKRVRDAIHQEQLRFMGLVAKGDADASMENREIDEVVAQLRALLEFFNSISIVRFAKYLVQKIFYTAELKEKARIEAILANLRGSRNWGGMVSEELLARQAKIEEIKKRMAESKSRVKEEKILSPQAGRLTSEEIKMKIRKLPPKVQIEVLTAALQRRIENDAGKTAQGDTKSSP
jgi:hypothetical protein